MATGRAIVENALEKLSATITPDDARAFSDTTLEQVWQGAREIEKEQGARLDLRFMRRIEPLLKSLESYAGAIEVFCQGFPPMAFVWGPIKLMLQLARQYSNVMDKILSAFGDIADVLPGVDRLKATFGDKTDFQQVLGLIYSDIIEFHQRAYRIFRRKTWHIWFAFDWGLFERRFKSILHNLASHCNLLDREAAALHFSEMKLMRDKRQLDEENFERYRQNQMAQQVFAWLAAAEDHQEEYLHFISDNRQPKTCNWILDDAQIYSWIEDDHGDAVIWMTGIPGAGKSFLCSLIIQNLETRQDMTSLYFFCHQRSSDQSCCALVLRTLAIQLLRQNLDLAVLVHQAYLQKGLNCSSTTMKRVFKEILPAVKATRIVLDGIDEYNVIEQQEILKYLLDLSKITGNNCKLLISSRNESSIEKMMKMMSSKIQFNLDGKTTQGLNLYIWDRVEHLKACFPEMEATLLVRAEKRLQNKAKGMFLWVRLVSNMLEHQMSELDFENAIEQLPDGLDEAYGQILSRFCVLDCILKDRILKILFWICIAYRPIGIHELADGISLKPGQTILGRKTRSRDLKRDILDICAPLIEKSSNGTLDLVHFTAKEYLLHKQSGPFIKTAKAHLSIAFSCITNLNSTLAILPRYNERVTEAELENLVVQGSYGLQPYGYQFWVEHLVAFLKETRDLDGEALDLISALEAFSKVRKGYQEGFSFRPIPQVINEGLIKLERFPPLLDFVSSWLQFKFKLNEKLPTFTDIGNQKQWQLQTDETYLSLIDSRLREITERLLMMKPSALPRHIDENDHKLFVSRFRLACRALSCNYEFDSMQAREAHETTHMTSFPCLQCDFAERGFKSRKDLERHTRKYHMSPEDFEIPSDLDAARISAASNELTAKRFSGSGCWNEQGRKDLQQGFKQVLAKIESRIRLEGHKMEQQKSGQSDSGIYAFRNTYWVMLSNMRDKVELCQYQTLTNFRNDINTLSNAADDDLKTSNLDVGAICEHELEKTMSEFPALASFKSTVRNHESNKTLPSENQESLQQDTKVLNEHQSVFVSSDANFGKRKPYWSLAEEKAFPKLLEQCGRNLTKIADYLKTKTSDEIDQYLTERTELSNLASAADARSSSQSQSSHLALQNDGSRSEKILVNDSNSMNQLGGPTYVEKTTDETKTLVSHQQGLNSGGDPNKSQSSTERSSTTEKPETPKRRLPLRVLCPHCSTHENGLRDIYALKKHIDRFHKPTRSVWICDDVSIDKNFLAKCKSCSKVKRYTSEHNAGHHLRLVHFTQTTPMKTLHRWMRETEEPNPNYERSTSDSLSVDFENQVLDQWPRTKRQKTNGKPPLHKKLDLLNGADLLPAMRSSPGKSNAPGNQDFDEESSESSSTDSKLVHKVELLPNVSFDNFLPGQMMESLETNTDGPPHRTTPALIKVDQVQRLPHLNPIHKTTCRDQVEAYYQILDTEPGDSSKYQETLESLSSLSETLLRNLRDWQRHSACAPDIPVSI